MGQGYLRIRNEYLAKAWARSPAELAVCLPAEIDGDRLIFPAFGERCILSREEIWLAGQSAAGPVGLLVALYASCVPDLEIQLNPLKSFKELPHSMPYHAAFAANAEQILVPLVTKIHLHQENIVSTLSGYINQDAMSGDFSFTLLPLPRIPLYYIFHLPDDEFPASVTCLFSNNASLFMPIDGLADVAEYTGKKIISMIAEGG
jgi:hypothetical protein